MKKNEKNLIKFAEEGDLAGVQEYLEKGTNINAKDDDGRTALMLALIFEHLEIAKCLVENSFAGADVNASDEDGYTPLMYASKNGHLNIVRYLESLK